MILKTIPRTWQAAVALVVMIVSLQQVFVSLQTLVIPDMQLGIWGTIKLVGGLIAGIGAAVAFYYYQGLALAKPAGSVHPLETLNKSLEIQKKEAALHHSATPVFSSRTGEIKPPEPPKPTT